MRIAEELKCLGTKLLCRDIIGFTSHRHRPLMNLFCVVAKNLPLNTASVAFQRRVLDVDGGNSAQNIANFKKIEISSKIMNKSKTILLISLYI